MAFCLVGPPSRVHWRSATHHLQPHITARHCGYAACSRHCNNTFPSRFSVASFAAATPRIPCYRDAFSYCFSPLPLFAPPYRFRLFVTAISYGNAFRRTHLAHAHGAYCGTLAAYAACLPAATVTTRTHSRMH